ncbi:MAG: thioredoxin family protein [Arcobacteraceae bacterium]|nr:thioredoxin family protein [Arcobacteraceae bacterium]
MGKIVSKMLIVFLTIFGLSSANASSDEPMLEATPFSQIKDKIGKVPMMLEFGSTSCHGCVVMGKLLYKIKNKYPKSNIYFIDIYKDMNTAKKFKIRMIPTQKYLDKEGNIVDAHMGVIEQEELEKKLKTLKVL